MRTTFINTLLKEAIKDRNIMLLTADLGFSVVEEFMDVLPEQFLNVGVAEQNMTGVAAGMAIEGKIPVIYSIVPFTTMRNFEQVRNDICYQNLNVKIVGVGAGFSYGAYGHTHHSLEDIGILRTLPNLVILTPGDPVEVELATHAMLRHNGPVYLRIGKKGEPNIHARMPKFKIGKGILVKDGTDVTLVVCSTMLETGAKVAQALEEKKVSTRLISMLTIKPFDNKIILDSAKKTKAVFTLEEHSIIGGLGSVVAEILAEHEKKIKFKRIGVPDRFTKEIGLQDYMRRANSLSSDQIVSTIMSVIR